MTDEERRRYITYAAAAAHLRAAAGLLHDLEPDLARRYSADASRLYTEAAPLIGRPDPLFEYPDERRQ